MAVRNLAACMVVLALLAGCNFPLGTQTSGEAGGMRTNPPPEKGVLPSEIPFGIQGRSQAEVQLVQQAGAAWYLGSTLLWSVVEPQPGERNWENVATFEKEMSAASAAGLKVILLVRDTPGWAQKVPGASCSPPSEEALPAFAAFLADAVKRYSAPPFNVRYWELGNEPDVDPSLVKPDSVFGCWGDPSDPYYGGGYYAAMLKQAYPQIKSADPHAQVQVGGLLLDCDPRNPPQKSPGTGELRDCSASNFLEGILINGGGDYLDGVSFHAYDYYAPPAGFGNSNWHASWDTTGTVLAVKIRFLRDLLARYGYSDKYLINTEAALLCGRDGRESACQSQEFIEARSSYLVKTSVAALTEGLRANLWYILRGWRGSELVDEMLAPNPGFQAYQFMVGQLRGATSWKLISLAPEVAGYEFNRAGERVWLLWAKDGSSHTVGLPEAPQAVYDVQGNPLPVGAELSVSISPVYVVLK